MPETLDATTIIQTYNGDGQVPSPAYIPGNGIYTVEDDAFFDQVSPNDGLSFPQNRPTLYIESRKVTYSQNALGNTVKTYKTQDLQDVTDLAAYYGDWGFAYEILTGREPWLTFTVTIPYDEITQEDFFVSLPASETWEIVPTTGIQDIMNAPYFTNNQIDNNPAIVFIPTDLKQPIQLAYDQHLTSINYTPSGSSDPNIPYIPYANSVLALKNARVEGLPTFGHTLKRTVCIDLANTNDNFNTTTDQFLKDMQTRYGIINIAFSKQALIDNYEIPDTVASFLVDIYSKWVITPVNSIGAASMLKYGSYLAKLPTLQFVTNSKLLLQQDFVFDEWVASGYGLIIGDNEAYNSIPLITYTNPNPS